MDIIEYQQKLKKLADDIQQLIDTVEAELPEWMDLVVMTKRPGKSIGPYSNEHIGFGIAIDKGKCPADIIESLKSRRQALREKGAKDQPMIDRCHSIMPDMFALAKEGERWHLLECSRTMNHVNSERLFTGTLDEVYGFLLANTGAA